MFTVHDYRQTGMPVLATVTTAEAGFEFAARMGFRESACVLPYHQPMHFGVIDHGAALADLWDARAIAPILDNDTAEAV